MPWPVHPTGFFGARGDNDTYRIERSLRFNSADSAYLNRTFSAPTSQSVFTLSLWIKLGVLGTSRQLFGVSTNHSFGLTSGDALNLTFAGTSALTTTGLFRDPSAWYHIVWTQNSNAHTIYVNGVSISTATATSNTFNTAVAHQLGAANTTNYFNGYLTEIHFIDGQALTPSSFGETDAITGRWKAKAYSGTYGTNGFYLKFADNSGTTATTLGKDSSGNGNNWTPNNFSVADGTGNDSLLDSPTNSGTSGNYATLNPLKASSTSASISDGNLDVTFTQASQARRQGSLAVKTGKYYFETRIVSVGGNYPAVGVMLASTSDMNNYAGFETGTFGYYSGGGVNGGGAGRTYSTYTTDDIIGVALDLDNSQIVFYKNGVNAVTSGTLYESLTSGEIYVPAVSGFNSARLIVNFGQRPFAYTAPSGFKALCTTNLPQPTIQKPSKYMDVVAYTGTGASNSISSLGFSPDLVWIKNRGGATSHAIYDTTRGTQAQLSSDTTGDEVTSSTGLTAFGSNGFTIGTSSLVNTSGTQYVAWAWDEAPIAGMDIVSYTGSGANRTISHTLGVAPKMMIVKARVTASTDQGWPVYHTGVASDAETDYLLLNSTAAAADLDTVWNDTAPTSSVFSVGTNALVNANNDTYIAYLFAEVEGFSKFGSYTGNGSADGPFVWCGFRPRWVMVKNTSASATVWCIWDTARDVYNLSTTGLQAQASTGDSTGFDCDITSSGFKIRDTEASLNGSGNTIIFAAFAESPFKYARAR